MFSLLLLLSVCVGYYYVHQFYPRETSELLYFGLFIVVWFVFIYLMNFEEVFMYQTFKQIYDVQQKPLYDISLFANKSKDHEFTSMLLQNQGSRCGSCGNFILPKDIDYTSLNYKTPLHEGGQHNHDNLQVVCPTCNSQFY
jgi:hypothetical protein